MMFLVLTGTGLMSVLSSYSTNVILIHVISGLLFLLIVLFHLRNNIRMLLRSLKSKGALVALVPLSLISMFWSATESHLADWYFSLKRDQPIVKFDPLAFEVYDKSSLNSQKITVEFLAGKHFWYPQVSVWLEDEFSNFLQTIFVSHSTAKGVFYGDRTKDNFRQHDREKPWVPSRSVRRVDALPYWSHRRGIQQADGLYAPSRDVPIVDAISGATPSGHFQLHFDRDSLRKFKLLVEVNVAFDENAYYSEFDFPDDTSYHSGAGLMGQPSLVYHADIDLGHPTKYYLAKLQGHGHHSGSDGRLYQDLQTITTATEIFDRILIHVQD